MTIQAIPTRYAGCHFRSRLEARWAVFFDALGVEWEYEAEGYELPSGRYLPDFLLPRIDTWGSTGGTFFEVKPDTAIRQSDARWTELGAMRPVIVAFGMPRVDQDRCYGSSNDNGWMEIFDSSGWDNCRAFCVCPECGTVGIEFGGRYGRIACHSSLGDRGSSADHPRIIDAYAAAWSARFEFGESGAS